MADDISDELKRQLSGAADSASGAVSPELGALLRGESPSPSLETPTTEPTATSNEVSPELKQLIGGSGGDGLVDTFGKGFYRGVKNIESTPDALTSIYKEYQGDIAGSQEAAHRAKATTDEAGDSTWDLTKIKSPGDFGYWLTEKLGEQGPNLLAMAAMGLPGAMVGGTIATALKARALVTESTAQAIRLAGMTIPGAAGNVALETGNTSQEQFEATGSTQPGTSVLAGVAKGVLESLVPVQVSRALMTPGAQLGKTTLGAAFKIGVEESATEFAQEAVDIAARKYNDPKYKFFDDGPTWWGPGPARLAESAAAGFFVGGIYGAPFARRDVKQGQTVDPDTGEKLQQPGSRETIQDGPTTRSEFGLKEWDPNFQGPHRGDAPWSRNPAKAEEPKNAVESAADRAFRTSQERAKPQGFQAVDSSIGPVTAARQAVLGRESADRFTPEVLANDARDDLMSVRPLIANAISQSRQETALDALDASVPRYVEVFPDGRMDNRVLTDTELELHNVLTKAQSEKPKLLKVNPGSIQPAAMTALVSDLPEAGSERIWFVGQQTPEVQQQLRAEYGRIRDALVTGPSLRSGSEILQFEAAVKPLYEGLLARGLRVMPSRGAGFHYTGTINGEPVEDVKTTGRSQHVGMYYPETREVLPFKDHREVGETPFGIPVSLDKNKLNPADVTQNADGSFTLKNPLNIEKMVPGISPVSDQLSLLDATVGYTREDTVTTDYQWSTILNPDAGKAVRDVVNKLAPIIKNILTSVGIDGGMHIMVTDREDFVGDSVGRMYVDQGIMTLSPKQLSKVGDIERSTVEIVMHELGHQITFHHYRQMPVEIQEQLQYAHNKALLAYRLDSTNKRSVPADVQSTARYFLSFTEWLAEQFRRWAGSDQQVRSQMDRELRAVQQKVEKFYLEWERKVSRKSAMDLSQPDYFFSAFMQYLRDFGSERSTILQRMRQQTLYQINQDILDNPTSLQIAKQAELGLRSMTSMFPPGVRAQLNQALDPGIVPGMLLPVYGEAAARAIQVKNMSLIELAVGSMKAENAYDHSRSYIAHELVHIYKGLGLITANEETILMRDIRAGRDPAPKGTKATLKAQVEDKFSTWTPEAKDAFVEKMFAEEQLAYYLQEFVDTGLARSEEAKTILAWLIAALERVRNFMQGLGYQTREDVIRAFFKGEMVHRPQQRAQAADSFTRQALMQEFYFSQASGPIPASRVIEVPGYQIDIVEEFGSKLNAKHLTYNWRDTNDGQHVATLQLDRRGDKGFEIGWMNVEVTHPTLAMQMLNIAEQDLGIKVKIPGQLSEEGYKASKYLTRMRRQGNVMDLFQQVVTGYGNVVENGEVVKKPQIWWVSPHWAKAMFNMWFELAKSKEARDAYKSKHVLDRTVSQKEAIINAAKYKALLNKLPANVWDDPRLDQMFSLRRNNARDETQGSMIRAGTQVEENKLLSTLGHPMAGTTDVFTSTFQLKQQLSQAENAREFGLPVDLAAPSQVMTMESRKLWEWSKPGGRVGNDPRIDKYLKNQKHEADRIGWFTKMFWGLHQLAWRNEHILGLRKYLQYAEGMNMLGMKWMRRADETARAWEELKSQKNGAAQMDAISQALFALTEMDYLLPNERMAGIKRLPMNWDLFLRGVPTVPNSELDRLLKKAGVKPENYKLIGRIANDFQAFLKEVEDVRLSIMQRTMKNSPSQLQAAQAKLATEMAELRSKPYFPMVRFGEFTIAVRDPTDNNRVVWASAYETQRQRDSAVQDVRRMPAHQGMDITIGRVAPSAIELMSLPGPLLRAIKENMFDKANKTPEQLALIDEQLVWLEEFEMMNAPDKTFRKRWMPTQGLPGYSTDSFRTYAHYFMSGSRYLARLAHMDLMTDAIREVNQSVISGQLGNTAKRQAIVKYMRDHFNYIMEGGRDSGKLRAAASMWFLGFSPAAAATNLSQIFTATLPTLSGHFGVGRAYAQLGKTLDAMKLTAGKAVGNASFTNAREEMQRQGRIDVGQAPELGSFAEGNNLAKLMAGTKGEMFWRGTAYWSMKMFGAVEQFNRELTFKAAWDLALAQPNIKRMQEIDLNYPIEVADLVTRVGLTHNEALAFMFAKEMIDRTQFQYGKYTDPPFMRGEKTKNLLIFFKYTQSQMYALRFNGSMMHMYLVFAFLYGLNGMPGAEDFNELLRLLAKKIFGTDFDLAEKARAFARSITRDTIFDKTGPDLVMHGISRYGFGPGLLPQGWGAPRFDASANGSMGRVVPGMADLMHGLATDSKTKDMIADAMQKGAGAGYGYIFSLFHYLSEPPGTTDSKKWESLLPRFAHATAKAVRYGYDPVGYETTSNGAKIAKFDVRDPDDVATVLWQVLGFSPTKVTETWEMRREVQDTKRIYEARRLAIYAQADKAIQSGNQAAIDDVYKAVQIYNEGAAKLDPQMQINGSQLRQSILQRIKSRIMTENVGASNKRDMMITDRIKDLYPGVQFQQRVK